MLTGPRADGSDFLCDLYIDHGRNLLNLGGERRTLSCPQSHNKQDYTLDRFVLNNI